MQQRSLFALRLPAVSKAASLGKTSPSNKTGHWIASRYWLVNRGGVGSLLPSKAINCYNWCAMRNSIMRHTKVQGCRSLFDGDWVIGQRMGKLPSQIAKLLKQQKVNAMSADSIFS